MQILSFLAKLGPLYFAFGFIMPLLMQIMERAEIAPPFGLSTLVTAAIIAGTWGLFAQLRGSWIWVK